MSEIDSAKKKKKQPIFAKAQTHDAEKADEANKDKKTVHLIPHSHTDADWVAKTEDFYSLVDHTKNRAQTILDSTIEELLKDEEKTFTFSEINNFKNWYDA